MGQVKVTVDIAEGNAVLDDTQASGFVEGAEQSLLTTLSGPTHLGWLGTITEVELVKPTNKPAPKAETTKEEHVGHTQAHS